MLSLNSSNEKTKVINSRDSKKRPLVWRRRQGLQSGILFTTYERPSFAENKPITTTNGTDTFNLGRLIISIAAAFSHDVYSAKYNSLWIAQTVEDALSMNESTLSPKSIAETTYTVLKRYDELAAVQYAAKHHLIREVRKRGRPSVK